ncbi:MAG: hypothetical protein J6C52_00570 [Clostridia bacterium]|nr:hypothetical protein [Clostridia bacterium]
MDFKRYAHSLTVILLVSTLTSCTSSGDELKTDQTDGTESSAAETLQLPDLPDMKWNGTTFSIYCRYGDGNRAGIADTVYLAEESGYVLDDAVVARMRSVSERFGITFSMDSPLEDPFGRNIQNVILSGDDVYQLIIPHAEFSILYAQNGLAFDWNELPYVNLDQPWWSKDASESLNIGNKIFMVADDITHNSLAETQAMLFVKQYLSDAGLEYPYQLVKDGKWTLDKLNEFASLTSHDLNGDTKLEPEADRLGYITHSWAGPISVLCSAGIRICEVDDGGQVKLTVSTERTADVFEKYFKFLDEPHSFCDATLKDEITYVTNLFRNGHASFMPATLMDAELLRSMDQEFGILPIPKYDEKVQGYPTLVDGGASMLVVPVTVRDPEMVSAVLEALCWENYYHVIPAYYEKVLKSKAASDNESAEMIEIIRAGRVFDVGYYYTGGAFQYIGTYLTSSEDRSFASYYAKNESAALAKISEINILFNN